MARYIFTKMVLEAEERRHVDNWEISLLGRDPKNSKGVSVAGREGAE